MSNCAIEILKLAAPVMPVVELPTIDKALPLAEALLAGGVKTIELTLRTDCALEAISLLRQQAPELKVGAGTIKNVAQYHQAVDAGSEFVISPGLTPDMLSLGQQEIPLIPGVMTASEVMTAMDAGFKALKLFPAAVGGPTLLKGLYGPFSEMVFCPTGGISLSNMHDYLSLPNVHCVGGSWIAPKNLIAESDWAAITQLAKDLHSN